MQPSALSVEPLLILSLLIFAAAVLPCSSWITWKWPPKIRVITIQLGLIILVYIAFNLGRMTGLSMAWYHWRREYKEPLWEWQIEIKKALETNDTNRLIRMSESFAKENIQSYGLEKLFQEGKFRELVETFSNTRTLRSSDPDVISK
jgi:hypothetical protein